jgi:hypothetical protein
VRFFFVCVVMKEMRFAEVNLREIG